METIRLPYSIIEDGHVKKVGTEIINQDSIIDMSLMSDSAGNPVMAIITSSAVYEIDCTNAYSVHKACEFLRSLNLLDANDSDCMTRFGSYQSFALTIQYCMCLLPIKRVMDNLGYEGTARPADIHSDLLNRQKIIPSQTDDLTECVQKAIKHMEGKVQK